MIAVIDGCGNNISSLTNALKKIAAQFVFTHDKQEIKKAEKVILPGVGSARVAMHNLAKHGLIETIQHLEQPVLGICLGMQLLFEQSDEEAMTCLKIIPGVVKKIAATVAFPVPHMGWNRIHPLQEDPLLIGLAEKHFYFVHSYYAEVSPYTLASTTYGADLSAVVKRRNFYGTQFHPEKSAGIGAQLLTNFVRLP